LIKMTDSELYHYGTPRHSGRYPWGSGVRPYQGEKHDITRSTDSIGKHKQYNKDINDIYKTFSDREKSYIQAESPNEKAPKYYYDPKTKYDTANRVYADVIKIKDVPVAFIEYWQGHIEDENIIDISIGVRNDPKYRHAGYASRLVEKGNKEIEKMAQNGTLDQSINRLIWGTDSENSKSIQTAIKLGFEESEEFTRDNGQTYKLLSKNIRS